MTTPGFLGTVFVGTSLDGFIARPDGALDFLHAGGTEDHGFTELLKSVDVIVMGRHTWETVLGFGGWPYGATPVVALSSRPLKRPAAAEAVFEQMAGTPEAVAERLVERGWRRAYVDGGVTIQRFLAAGLIRRLVVSRVPVLIGQGIPLFGPLTRDIPLRHVATRAFPGGLVQSEYAITD
ncbi:MAG TPA: dihydrofolate reductase family protein [Gemmatimonadales bacterium]|nr:dihydrofolate reductase family protein [Gemmatimonadales bacterium]